jgi:hypothetical protein
MATPLLGAALGRIIPALTMLSPIQPQVERMCDHLCKHRPSEGHSKLIYLHEPLSS